MRRGILPARTPSANHARQDHDRVSVPHGFNRTENVRPISPSDPDFPALYSRRNDAESINRGIVDAHYLGRAHSLGHVRQHLNLLGYALMVNSVALHDHALRRVGPLPNAA